jgi:hypothetical protein
MDAKAEDHERKKQAECRKTERGQSAYCKIKDSCYLTLRISNGRREYPREGVSGGTSRSVLHRRVENPVDKL